jgi:hypothetical protein
MFFCKINARKRYVNTGRKNGSSGNIHIPLYLFTNLKVSAI